MDKTTVVVDSFQSNTSRLKFVRMLELCRECFIYSFTRQFHSAEKATSTSIIRVSGLLSIGSLPLLQFFRSFRRRLITFRSKSSALIVQEQNLDNNGSRRTDYNIPPLVNQVKNSRGNNTEQKSNKLERQVESLGAFNGEFRLCNQSSSHGKISFSTKLDLAVEISAWSKQWSQLGRHFVPLL
jgi:hypothetical protein